MRNKRKSFSMKMIFSTILLVILLAPTQLLANSENSAKNLIKVQEYTEEYQQWLELPEDKRNNTLEPRQYDVQYENKYSKYLKGINNKIKVVELLKSSGNTDYDLRDYIHMSVKNQESTNMCWAFASTATLETHLAIRDLKNGMKNVEYNFSERHMAYSTAKKSLLNSENNLYAFNSSVSEGGNFFMAEQYLTTGNGAVLDKYMPFVNTEESIDISNIQNKDVITTLLDTTLFATDGQTTQSELIAEMKSYITNYGGIYAGIHGADLLSDYYNNSTGAIYCDNSDDTPMNHAVLIIGWDDNFSKDKFGKDKTDTDETYTKCTPENNGAWIIKNSWGDKISKSLSKAKKVTFGEKEEYYKEVLGYSSAEEIPNETILNNFAKIYGEQKVSLDAGNDTITIEVGNNGYMYVSYDDANIYSNLWGIENAKTGVDYDNIYQHDALGYSAIINIPTGAENSAYMANVFSRDVQKEEELTKVSIFTNQEYICKIYVNPNGKDLTQNLQEVTLAEGNEQNAINIKPGYHTIELAEPVKLTGENFAIIMEISNGFERKQIAVETAISESPFEDAVIKEGESFVSFDMVKWIDTTTLNKPCNGNVTIKAFTNDGYTEEAEPEVPEVPEEKQPVLSDFYNTNAILTDIIVSGDGEYTITLNVDGIEIGDENTSYNYYWYVSGTLGDKDIKDQYWAEISADKTIKQNDGTYSLQIRIDSKNLPNIADLMNSDNLYIYIKEVATIDNNSKSQIVSKSIKIDVKVEEDTSDKIDDAIEKEQPDDTVVHGHIPKAGLNAKLIAFVIGITVVAVFSYNKFKYLDI